MIEEGGEKISYLRNVSGRNQLAGKNDWKYIEIKKMGKEYWIWWKNRGKLNNESLLHVHVPKISSVENLLLQQKSFSSVNHIIILHPGVQQWNIRYEKDNCQPSQEWSLIMAGSFSLDEWVPLWLWRRFTSLMLVLFWSIT